jgi:hypothetical protein
MSESIRRTKSSLKGSKTCHDALLLGLKEPRDLCRNCRNYFDLPVKKKPQCDMGILFSKCERPQINGISPSAITRTLNLPIGVQEESFFITTLLLKFVCPERNEPKSGSLGQKLHLFIAMQSR